MATPTLSPSIAPTHPAVVITAARAPLSTISVPTEAPGPGEVLIHVLWTSSTPFDLHQSDGGLGITPPHLAGGSFGGTVAQLGEGAAAGARLTVGDVVFGFDFRLPRARAHQTYLTTDAYMVSKLPAGLTLPEAVAVSANLVTAFHVTTADLGLPLPWPRPADFNAGGDGDGGPTILVWGAAGSVGNYTLQVLRHWGYGNLLAVAAGKHHAHLRELGARECFDYTRGDVAAEVLAYAGRAGGADGRPRIPYIIDCIGSLEGTVRPISRVAEPGATVAVMLPVIKRHASEDVAPEFEMDVSKVLPGEWKEGVELKGTRAFLYLQVSSLSWAARGLEAWIHG